MALEAIPIPVETPREQPSGLSQALWKKIQEKKRLHSEKKKGCLYLDCDRHGVGDTILSIWIAEGARGFPQEVIIKASDQRAFLMKFFCTPFNLKLENAAGHKGEYIQYKHGVGFPSFLLNRALSNGIPTYPLRPSVDYSLLVDKPKIDVLFFPHAHAGSRSYPWENVVKLHELCRRANIGLKIICERKYTPTNIDRLINPIYDISWFEIISYINNARVIIGADSGPAHIAGTMDKPTIALLGRTTSDVFVHCRSVDCLQTERKDLPCSGCWNGWGYDSSACEKQCESLLRLSPNVVFERIEQKLYKGESKNRYLPDSASKVDDARIADMVEVLLYHKGMRIGNTIRPNRNDSFSDLFQHSKLQSIDKPRVVEIGSLTCNNGWSLDGMSSLIFSYYCRDSGGTFDTVDSSRESYSFAQKVLKRFPSSNCHNMAGIEYLTQRKEPIDILYFDSFSSNTAPLQQETLNEFKASENLLHDNSLVLFDDTHNGEGRAGPTIKYMIDNGWRVLFRGFQTLLGRN